DRGHGAPYLKLESATASAIERSEWCNLNSILAQTRGFGLPPGRPVLPEARRRSRLGRCVAGLMSVRGLPALFGPGAMSGRSPQSDMDQAAPQIYEYAAWYVCGQCADRQSGDAGLSCESQREADQPHQTRLM